MGKQKETKKKRGKLLPVILIALLSVIIVGAVYVLTPPSQKAPPEHVPPKEDTGGQLPEADPPQVDNTRKRKPNFYTVLLVGTMDNYNTDSIMLASIDSDLDLVNVISIPRDTMIDVKSNNMKINGVYGVDGVDQLCAEVQRLTGVYPDYNCVLNVESFMEVVDLIGGVEFNVPYNMHHVDLDPRFTINLKRGVQTLNGKKALQLVRYRGTSQSDFGRMQLQRDFLLAVVKKALNSFSVSQISDMLDVVGESVKTNMPVKDMLWFYLNVVREINLDQDVVFQQMPVAATGKYKGRSYVYLDKTEMLALINQTLNPYNQDITESEVTVLNKAS